MGASGTPGPDLAIVGAARSGTTFLASLLGAHPAVDPGAVKEPNYFSRELERGPEWYDGQHFSPRRDGLLRMDASVSYTFPQFPDALAELVKASPDAFVVYAVRHPLQRLLSHYHLHRDYFGHQSGDTLGEALAHNEVFAGASDYALWLDRLTAVVRPERLLVVPLPVTTTPARRQELIEVIGTALGLDLGPFAGAEERAGAHRNQVVEFRSGAVNRVRKAVRKAGLYPTVRRLVGPDRLRRIRSLSTRPVVTESLPEALGTCSPEQLDVLRRLYASARTAAAAALAEQDARRGLAWHELWAAECPDADPIPGAAG